MKKFGAPAQPAQHASAPRAGRCSTLLRRTVHFSVGVSSFTGLSSQATSLRSAAPQVERRHSRSPSMVISSTRN
eukprot:4007531-Prymnesium_polylepis.1